MKIIKFNRNSLALQAGEDLINANPNTFIVAYISNGEIHMSADGFDSCQQIGLLEKVKLQLLTWEN